MMDSYSYDINSLQKNGQPWFPFMGEFHFSRYPNAFWKEELLKMKMAGIQIVASYVIWIHHEEKEGYFDFTGQRDLHKFVELCAECGLKFFIRIGPWVHAEVRNGGFPDWLLKKEWNLRLDDENYLEAVKKFWVKIYEQVEEFLYKNRGTIIGCQIENEYGLAGGYRGKVGEKHMTTLTTLAREIGFDLPIFTATGWGGACTGGLLPVMGGYCDASWEKSLEKQKPNENFLLTPERNDINIGSDYDPVNGNELSFDPNNYPFLTAELGGGIEPTYHRRPIIKSQDVGAMTLAKLGSGCNLLGFYMFHGGINPKGKYTTLHESYEAGAPNRLPELNYDFQAPLGSYGQFRDSYYELKLFGMFIHDFGEELCCMFPTFPEDAPKTAADLDKLRVSVRKDGNSGYIFVNNYQRNYKMTDHLETSFKVKLKGQTINYPKIDIKNQDYFFYPFHLKIGQADLIYATATPLCILNQENWVFYGKKDACFKFDGQPNKQILLLSREEALHAWKIYGPKEVLCISQQPIFQNGNCLTLVLDEKQNGNIKIYPKNTLELMEFTKLETNDGLFDVYELPYFEGHTVCNWKQYADKAEQLEYEIQIYYDKKEDNIFLDFEYEGDVAELFLNGEKIFDDFWKGDGFQIGLHYYGYPELLTLKITKLRDDGTKYFEATPEFDNGMAGKLKNITVVEQKRIRTFLKY